MPAKGNIVVPPHGSLDAPILVVAESPAENEERTLIPLSGPSGWLMDDVLREVGLSPDEILKTNVHWTAAGKWPTKSLDNAHLLAAWAEQLDEVIKESKAKVVVTMGGPALQRMTGLTNVTDWRGSTLRFVDDPFDGDEMSWHHTLPRYKRRWPTGAMLVPTLHPSGILRDPRRSSLFLFKRDWEKVAKIVRGSWTPLEYEFHIQPDPHAMWSAFQGASEVYFDTEFNPETMKGGWPYLIGMTCNGRDIWNCPLTGDYVGVVREILQRKETLKGAHNIIADFRALWNIGIDVAGEWWCSLIGMYVCHPGTEVGLSPTSRYYLDDVQHRKWMDKSDERYNCFDVLYGWHSRQGQLREIRDFPVDRMGEAKVRMRLLRSVTGVMEDRGLYVDREVQAALKKEKLDEAAKLRVEVDETVRPRWEAHIAARQGTVEEAQAKRAELLARFGALCPVHKKGWLKLPAKPTGRGKLTTVRQTIQLCKCQEIHESGLALQCQEEMKAARNAVLVASKGLKKQAEGFNPKSRDHLAWFLYSPEALRLPLQRDHKTRSLTTGKHAIEKLSKLAAVRKKPEAWKVVQAIKRIQECEADVSRFIDIPVDDRGFTYPPHKIHGSSTGRMAGGEDDKGEEDKITSDSTLNAYNVPSEFRGMYVAPHGWAYVYADYAGQEARLFAYFTQDPVYLQHFAEEDAGGPDVHSRGAAIFFGIDPADARKVKLKMAGRELDGRSAAKTARHAANYNILPHQMLIHQLGCDMPTATRIADAYAETYRVATEAKATLVAEVLGRYEPTQSAKPFARQVERGRGWLSNPFGWTNLFAGKGEVKKHPVTGELMALPIQANEVLAFRQQSTGASIWARCAVELGEAGVWEDYMPVAGGSYDALILLVPDTPADVKMGADLLKKVMTQAWPELGGLSLPVDLKWGYSLQEAKDGDSNGLRSF